MRFTLEYPISGGPYDPSLLEGDALRHVARAAEAAGFDGIAFTDHPAPSRKWLDNGGHDTFDPFAALAYVAAVTERIRLQTHLLVLPYRNPLLTAKSVATLDRLSGGRVTLAVGTGYLRSEFGALGVDFERRNELFDEALAVLREVFTCDAYSREGLAFTARGQALSPAPVQLPAPPVWVGGNSRRARERAALAADGWSPLLTTPLLAASSRTAGLSTVDELAAAVTEVRRRADEAGRDGAALDVQAAGYGIGGMTGGSGDEHRRTLDALRTAGVTWTVVTPPAAGVAQALDAIGRYGERVIAQSR